MYEFSDEGQSFKVDDLDLIMCTRLSKNKDENKFIYLYNAFCSIDNHLWAKRKENHGKIQEIKTPFSNLSEMLRNQQRRNSLCIDSFTKI